MCVLPRKRRGCCHRDLFLVCAHDTGDLGRAEIGNAASHLEQRPPAVHAVPTEASYRLQPRLRLALQAPLGISDGFSVRIGRPKRNARTALQKPATALTHTVRSTLDLELRCACRCCLRYAAAASHLAKGDACCIGPDQRIRVCMSMQVRWGRARAVPQRMLAACKRSGVSADLRQL
jgi:hypothetical protein